MATVNVWIPKNCTETAENEFGVVYFTPAGQRPVAIAYLKVKGTPGGRAKWHFSFPGAASMNAQRDQWFESLVSAHKHKAEQKILAHQAAKDLSAKVKVGDVFVCSWGWEQTNVDFYQVTAKNGRAVVVREIGSSLTTKEGMSSMSGYAEPVRDSFRGEPQKHLLGSYGFRLTSYSSASLWDGKPHYTSWYA